MSVIVSIIYADKIKRLKFPPKMKILSSQLFSVYKNNCEHLSQKVKKQVFFKTLFGFPKMDIYKCPNFISLFTFGNLFLHFSKMKENKEK
jgi:hypothetical protein